MRLRAVLFDLDETLIPEAAPVTAAYIAAARAAWGDQAGPERVEGLRHRATEAWAGGPCRAYCDRVQVGVDEALGSDFGGADEPQRALRAFLPRFRAAAMPAGRPSPFEAWRRERIAAQDAYPGALHVLHKLRERFRLGLVTNGPSDFQRAKAEGAGLAGCFNVIVASCDIGSGKPEPALFRAALAALGVTCNEAVMVGNDPLRDIAGAEAAGIRTLWAHPGAPRGHGGLTDLRALPELLSE